MVANEPQPIMDAKTIKDFLKTNQTSGDPGYA